MRNADSLTKSERRKAALFLLSGIIIIGILTGVYFSYAYGAEFTRKHIWLHQFFAPSLCGETVLGIFRQTFLSAAVFSVIAMILGFFAFGQPFSAALLVLRGIGIGSSAAFMYSLSGTKAFAAVLVLVLPKAAVMSFLAALSVRESLRCSSFIAGTLFGKASCDEIKKQKIQLYFIRFAVIFAAEAAVAVPDSLLIHWFTASN